MSEPKSSGLTTVCVSVRPCPCFRFICIYPVYINSKKTLAEGRRIPSEKVRRVRLDLRLQLVSGLLSCSTNTWNVFMIALLCVFLCAGCWEPLLLRDQRCPHCCWSQCLGGGKNLSRDHRSTNVLLWLWTEKLWLPVTEWWSCCTLALLRECVGFKHTCVYRAGIGGRNPRVESWVTFSRKYCSSNVKSDLFRIRCILGSGTGTSSFEVASESSWSRRTAASVRTSFPLVSSSLSRCCLWVCDPSVCPLLQVKMWCSMWQRWSPN